ncbi:MAG: patatin-like phospholipase family protein [Pseudomonadota bacterium]
MTKKRFVLAIDGGGVRGLVAATLLDGLARALELAGSAKPFADHFDLIAGTSTGAIIAAAIAAPGDGGKVPRRSPADLRKLYRTRSNEIFPRRFWCRLPVFGRLRQFFGPLYSPDPLVRILDDELADMTFADARRNLLICSYSIDPRGTAFFRGGPDYQAAVRNGHLPAGVTEPANGVLLKDAATGSAAAPTFFPPHQITDGLTNETRTVIDGGVFLNDPALLAFADAVMLYPDDEIHVVSIGTGRLTDPYPFDVARGWGFFEWLSPLGRFRTPLISAISDGQARAVNAQLQKLIQDRYYRLDYDLTSGYGSPNLDDASKRNLKRLEEGAQKMVDEMGDQFARIATDFLA